MPTGVGVFILPIPVVLGATKPTGDITLPMFSVEGTGYSLGDIFQLPMFVVTGSSEVRESYGIIRHPIPVITSLGYAGVLGKANIVLPTLTVSGLYGPRGIGSIIIPMFVVFDFLPQHGVGSLMLPVLSYSGFGVLVPISRVYRGIVANLLNQAISTYSNYPFNSLAYFQGKYLGANEQGIFVLDGDLDNGQRILSHLKTGTMDFGDSFIKHLRNIWLTYRSDGHLIVTVEVSEDNGETGEASTVMADTKIHEERLKVGRGLKGRFYTLELKNMSGADFDLDRISLFVESIRRKMR